MRYVQFKISNFRGIKHLTLDLDKKPQSPIITMVGLNESGKTTILEALFFFYENVGNDDITLHRGVVDDVHTLIPKRLKDNFNGEINIIAQVFLNDKDKRLIKKVCAQEGYKVSGIGDYLTITHQYKFKNSKHEDTKKFWDYDLTVIPSGKRKHLPISASMSIWNPLFQNLKKELPPIIYYPNFLFEFPNRIYLTDHAQDSEEQEFYRYLLQDILDSLENELEIEPHLVSRAMSTEGADQDALESVVNKMGVKVTSIVFNPDLSVFQERESSKSISFTKPAMNASTGTYYIELKLRDGEDSFYIHERSLGFRWFFTFIIFTQFRVRRIDSGAKPLFLFDEPASNLHQTAQKRLLKAFEELTINFGATIIYSTHSHHLINPQWLESAFIVQNKALKYDENETLYTAAMTDIDIIKYRKFVAENPDQRTYFQPILDVLDYQPSLLENVPNIIMLEGKNDFYAIAYMKDIILQLRKNLNLLPGGGAGSLDCVIQIYLAWGKEFVVLLDSDSEGYGQKERYIDKYGKILEDKIFTLAEALEEQTDSRVEELFEQNDKMRIQKLLDPTTGIFSKKLFYLSMQECLINKHAMPVSVKTKDRFRKLINKLSNLFA